MSKIKSKKQVKSLIDEGVGKLFNQMIGCDDPDTDIVYKKYGRIHSGLKYIHNVLSQMTDVFSGYFSSNQKSAHAELIEFVKNFGEELEKLQLIKAASSFTKEDYMNVNKDPALLEKMIMSKEKPYDAADLLAKYSLLKASKALETIIITVGNIRGILPDKNVKITAEHILGTEGFSLRLFDFCSLDFKLLCSYDDPDLGKYIVMLLQVIYDKGVQVTTAYTDPDIDADEFCSGLLQCILRAQNDIPRCEKAFGKIKKSLNLLRSNFPKYYKDFVVTKSPVIIFEGFLLDVAKDGNGQKDPVLTQQFNTIVKTYSKAQSQGAKDPVATKLFDMLNVAFNAIS